MTYAEPNGGRNFQMIRSIEIRNFRCYEHLLLSDVARINLVVGDNGSGKTSLLEAIFLALGASPEIAVRMRQQRGLEGSFGGTAGQIEEALWGDFFYEYDMSRAILVEVSGDGPENRTLQISRGSSSSLFAVENGGVVESGITAPLVFQWTDASKVSRSVMPIVTKDGFQLPTTGEDLPDFYYIGTAGVSASENAARFSSLSKRGLHRRFVDTFIREYDWLEDINLELHATAPVLFGTLRGSHRKVPMPNISSGINRIMAILLCMAANPRSIVLVDEIETGVYYSHLPALWRAVRYFAQEYQCQIITSTHSKECIDALIEEAGKDTDDLAVWRTERNEEGHEVRQLTGEDAHLIFELDEEIR